MHINDSLDKQNEYKEFVKECFKKHYNASISIFLPKLIGVYKNDSLQAVFGINENNNFFLSNYFEENIENIIFNKLNKKIKTCEIGNLAVFKKGLMINLFNNINSYLLDNGYEYFLCTATTLLANSFKKYNIEAIEIGIANPNKLNKEILETYGSYYKTNPKVYIIKLKKDGII